MGDLEWKRLVMPLLPDPQDWQVQGGRLLYRAPAGRILLGVLAEASATRGHRYVWRLTMPLFEPQDAFDLSYSERIGGGSSTVDVEDVPAMAAAVSEAIRTLPSEDHEMARLADLSPGPNIRLSETAAYANAYLGHLERALSLSRDAGTTADKRDWVQEISARLRGFERLLRDEGQEGAVAHLDAQVTRTAEALGLLHA